MTAATGTTSIEKGIYIYPGDTLESFSLSINVRAILKLNLSTATVLLIRPFVIDVPVAFSVLVCFNSLISVRVQRGCEEFF